MHSVCSRAHPHRFAFPRLAQCYRVILIGYPQRIIRSRGQKNTYGQVESSSHRRRLHGPHARGEHTPPGVRGCSGRCGHQRRRSQALRREHVHRLGYFRCRRDSRRQVDRRGSYLHAERPALSHRDEGVEGWQARIEREASGAVGRRGQEDARPGREEESLPRRQPQLALLPDDAADPPHDRER